MFYRKPILARIAFSLFKKIKYGEIVLTTPEGEVIHFGKMEKESDLRASFKLKDWSVIKNAINHADIGFGEDYIEGKWETDNLPNLLTIIVKNHDVLEKLLYGNIWGRIFFKIYNFFRPNSIEGSKKNIKAHYDVGNDFYKLWLDKTMTYSSGIFEGDKNKNLERAQLDKYARILSFLKPKGEILEIGCGWGGFAEEAVKENFKVKAITISKEQLKFAKNRLKNNNKAEIEFIDYRKTQGFYDYIVSIEMLEAVGEKYWPVYFAKIKELLKPQGKAIIQTIVIKDELFDRYKQTGDFVRRYTFPGGMLPSLEKLKEASEKVKLQIVNSFSFGGDYAITLHKWFDNFNAKIKEIKALDHSDEFIRSWQFYLSACIAVFQAERSTVLQLEIVHKT